MKPVFSLLLTSIFILILYLFSTNNGFSQESKDIKQSISWPEYITKGHLDNGLTYVIMEHNKPKNRIMAWLVVKAGSLQEKESERGIAHYLEHMGFNGTKNFPSGEIFKYFDSIGVNNGTNINGSTYFDNTTYFIQVPADKEDYLNNALAVLCDFASYMHFLPENIEKERGIILQELIVDSVVSLKILKKEMKIIFKNSIYADRSPEGIKEIVENLRAEDFQKFYSTWYRPDNMSLIVLGDCNPPEVEKKIKNIFASIPTSLGKKSELNISFTPHKEIYTGVITDPELKKSKIIITYLRNPEITNTKSDYKRDLCDKLILKMINMRFAQEKYKSDTPLIYSSGYIEKGIKSVNKVEFSSSINPEKSLEGLKVIMGYVEGIRHYGFTDTEKNEAYLDLLENLRTSKEEKDTKEAKDYIFDISQALIRDSVFIPPEEEYELAKTLLPTITTEEIKERIKYLLEPSNMSVIIEIPEKYGNSIKEDKISAIVESIIAEGGLDYKLKDISYYYDYNNLKSGEIKLRKDYKELNLTELKLSNGITVILKPTDFEKDTVRINYASLGGKLLESPDSPGISEVALKSWEKGGTEELTQFEVDRLTKIKNIKLNTGGSLLYGRGNVLYCIRGTSPKNNMEYLFQWMWQYLVRPGYRKEGIDIGIKLVQERIRVYSEYQEYTLIEELDRLILRNNPLSITATEEQVMEYKDPGELKRFQKISSIPSNSELIIIGSFDLEKTIPLVCKYFGSISDGTKPSIPSNYLKTEFPSGNTKRIIYKGMENRCFSSVVFPGCVLTEKDNLRLDLLAEILNLRYWKKIREEKSIVYLIHARNLSPLDIKGYGRLYINFCTNSDKIDDVINAIMDEIKDIQTIGPTKKELESVKKILLFNYEENLDNNNFWIENLEGSSIFNYNIEDIVKKKEKISNINEKEIQEVAVKYLCSKNNIILSICPEKD